jgi:hypothetical protein
VYVNQQINYQICQILLLVSSQKVEARRKPPFPETSESSSEKGYEFLLLTKNTATSALEALEGQQYVQQSFVALLNI